MPKLRGVRPLRPHRAAIDPVASWRPRSECGHRDSGAAPVSLRSACPVIVLEWSRGM